MTFDFSTFERDLREAVLSAREAIAEMQDLGPENEDACCLVLFRVPSARILALLESASRRAGARLRHDERYPTSVLLGLPETHGAGSVNTRVAETFARVLKMGGWAVYVMYKPGLHL